MAKAQITTQDGITVKVQGSPEEIAKVVHEIREPTRKPSGGAKREKLRQGRQVLLIDLVDSLVDGDFFKKPKGLAAIKAALEEMGHHYPVTTLSGTMLDQVRKRKLRRVKEKHRWMYTG